MKNRKSYPAFFSRNKNEFVIEIFVKFESSWHQWRLEGGDCNKHDQVFSKWVENVTKLKRDGGMAAMQPFVILRATPA